MRAVLLENNVVIGVDLTGNLPAGYVEAPDGVTNSFTYDPETGEFTAPAVPSVVSTPPLSRRQLLLGLLSIGIHEADVDAKIALLPADEVDASQITWRYASVYQREDPLVSTLAALFGLPDNQVDDLWAWASGL